ncbi:hypothetical protein GCM10010358_68100 [Streptomyces minutiscleroticus]|uniref:Uncharacterized protein n=1 Tax=Streptomyces minutiscleroticus TaxID=68238 RepID=A0A918NY60_9ACTN|nr:hypothetical protein GCM10010358_68100 [Streptomyces minutiscleroticus]
MFPETEPNHLHLDPHPACICTPLPCGAYALAPGCPQHGMNSGTRATWHFPNRCPSRQLRLRLRR